jgi:soluble lytic murein transglycosylase-like protein
LPSDHRHTLKWECQVIGSTRIGLAGFGVVLTANFAFVSLARADVFEIGDNGTVIVKAGSSIGDTMPDLPANALTIVAQDRSPQPFGSALAAAAETSGLSPTLLAALVSQESGWNPQARSPKGAVGLTQLMPATARQLRVNPANPSENLAGGARYLRFLYDRFDGDLEKTLAAYNAGPGRVAQVGRIPAITETRGYVAGIAARLTAVALKGQ